MKKLLPFIGNNRHLSLCFFLLFSFLFSFNVNGQDPCPGLPCTAGDIVDESFYIGDATGAPITTCDPGDVSAFIWLNFDVRAGTRYEINFYANVCIDGVATSDINICLGDFTKGAVTAQNIGSITFPCGSTLELKNAFFSYAPNEGGDAPHACVLCPDVPSKCQRLGNVTVDPPCPTSCPPCFILSGCMCIDDPDTEPGDLCTGPDPCQIYTYDADCNCVGTPTTDPCGCDPDIQPGDPCTGPDPCQAYTLDADCNCVGDGAEPPVCDPCEILNDDCECVDDPSTKPGKPCDDGDPCTEDDKYDENCYCVGTPIGEPGDACDDGNECTIDDVLDENCNCVGTSIGDNIDTDKDGIPDCLDDCPYMLDDFVYADLECGKTVYNNNIRGRSMFEEYGECTMPECPATGRELIYRITNHKPSDLIITLIEDEHPQLRKLNLFVIDDPCEPGCIGVLHAPRANGEGDQLVIPDAPAGVYYIIVDGNKPYAENDFSLRVDCIGGGPATCPPNAHYYEDFEGYTVGKPITSQDPVHWQPFSSSSRSPMISNDRASNGVQSLEFNRIEGGTQDVKLDLGKKFKGVWKICWNMYIEPWKTAHFGLFGGDYSDPWGTVSYKFEMGDMDFQGKWFDVELFVDLDANKYILFLDNRQYSKSGDYYLNLDFINFYGPPGAHFYVDRICYSETSSIPSEDRSSEGRLQYTDEELKDELSAYEISVFPNPAREEVYVDLRKYAGQAVNIKIFNSMSTEIFNRDIPEVTTDRARISLKGFTNGLHILSVQSEGAPIIAKKLVISSQGSN